VPEQFDRSNEHLVVLDDEIDEAAALEAIERAGGRVLHRIDAKTLIVVSGEPAAELSEALPPGARVMAPDAAQRAPGQSVVVDAFHLRASPAFRESKANRPHAGTDWGEGGLDEPDVPDADERPQRPPGPEEDGNPGPVADVTAHVLADEREEEKAGAAKALDFADERAADQRRRGRHRPRRRNG
jgi:hypothetical protein